MKKILTNICVVVCAALIVLLGSAWASFVMQQWHWFGRSGAILTLAGVVLSVRPLIRYGLSEWVRVQGVVDGGSFNPTPEEIEEGRQRTLDVISTNVGVYMTLVGTIIWAYGDLLGGIPIPP